MRIRTAVELASWLKCSHGSIIFNHAPIHRVINYRYVAINTPMVPVVIEDVLGDCPLLQTLVPLAIAGDHTDIFNNYWIIQSVRYLKGYISKGYLYLIRIALFWKISVLDTNDFCLLLQTEQCASFVYQGMITRLTITGFFVLV